MLERDLMNAVQARLAAQPAVVLLGPRQVGKTTLARRIAALASPEAVFLDLERAQDRARLAHPELFFARHRDRLVVLDEVQAMPDLFTALRPEIDADRRPGRFLLLGSASGPLLRQSAESLAGRVAYLELSPLLVGEVPPAETTQLWLRGGFPLSFTAKSDAASMVWRQDLIETLVARDLPQLGVSIPASTLRRFWSMTAHLHGQLFNASQLGLSLGGLAHTTVGRYRDLLVDAMLLRSLPPVLPNVGKRLTKSPKVYVRDSGLLHALLGVESQDALLGHPVVGASWEGFVIEQIIARAPRLSTCGFYRTAAGAELDCVVEAPGERIGFEIKLSSAPRPTRGFYSACDDLGVARAYVIALVDEPYPLSASVEVIGPAHLRAVLGPTQSSENIV